MCVAAVGASGMSLGSKFSSEPVELLDADRAVGWLVVFPPLFVVVVLCPKCSCFGHQQVEVGVEWG